MFEYARKASALLSLIISQCLLASTDSQSKIAGNVKMAEASGIINGIPPATAVGFGLVGGKILIKALDASGHKIAQDNNSSVVVTTTTGTTTTGTITSRTTTSGTTTTGTITSRTTTSGTTTTGTTTSRTTSTDTASSDT